MSRSFDTFGDDSITLSPGALAGDTGGPFSVVVLHRPVGVFCGLIHAEKASVTQWELWGEGSNYFVMPGGFAAGPAPVAATWQLIGYSKAAGTVTPRYHMVTLEGGSAGVWAHQDGTSTSGDWSGPVDALKIGHGQRRGNGLVAAIAVYTQTFNDAGWETTLGYTAAQDWFDAAPAGMWLLNQANTSDPVLDVTSGHADQAATTNPAVSASNPPGWDYTIVTDTSTGSGAQPRRVSATGHGRGISERQFPRITSRTQGGRL